MSLVQHWKLQDNAASTTVVATVGSNGTLAGGDNTSVLSEADGPGTAFPRSLHFNGTDDYVDVTGIVSFASGAAWSVAGWMKFDNFTEQQPLLGRSATDNHRVILATTTSVAINGNSAGAGFTVPTVSADTWYHVLVTHTTGNATRVFWNGTESSSGSQTIADTFAPNLIARSFGGATPPFNRFMDGKICDVRVYDSDESANVAAIMAEKNVQNTGMFFGE